MIFGSFDLLKSELVWPKEWKNVALSAFTPDHKCSQRIRFLFGLTSCRSCAAAEHFDGSFRAMHPAWQSPQCCWIEACICFRAARKGKRYCASWTILFCFSFLYLQILKCKIFTLIKAWPTKTLRCIELHPDKKLNCRQRDCSLRLKSHVLYPAHLAPLFELVRLCQHMADTVKSLHWNVTWWMMGQEPYLLVLPLTCCMIFFRT